MGILKVLLLATALALAAPQLVAASAHLTPISCCDGNITTSTIGGQTVWQTLPGSDSAYSNTPSARPR